MFRALNSFVAMLIAYLLFYIGVDAFAIFFAVYIINLYLYLPKYVLSPEAVIFGYYGVWFIIAPFFASGYSNGLLDLPEYQLSYLFVITTFSICIIAVNHGSRSSLKIFKGYDLSFRSIKLDSRNIFLLLGVLYALNTLWVILIVINTV